MFSVSDRNQSVNFFDQFLLFVVIKVHVPFGQTCLAGTILDQDEPDLSRTSERSRMYRNEAEENNDKSMPHHFDLSQAKMADNPRADGPENEVADRWRLV